MRRDTEDMDGHSLVTTWEDDIEAAKAAMSRAAYNVIDAGRLWGSAKSKNVEAHGGTGWAEEVQTRGVSVDTVDNLIAIYGRFGENLPNVAEILGMGSLKRLAAPSTPPEAVVHIIE